MRTTVICGGRVIDPSQRMDMIADVVCVEGKNIIIDLLLLGGEFLHLKSPFLQIQTDV